jgi:hypothetical protein
MKDTQWKRLNGSHRARIENGELRIERTIGEKTTHIYFSERSIAQLEAVLAEGRDEVSPDES